MVCDWALNRICGMSIKHYTLSKLRRDPHLKKGVLYMECKVRYFLTYYMHLVLKYILMLLIIWSHVCHVNTSCFQSCLLRCQSKETDVTNKGGCYKCL